MPAGTVHRRDSAWIAVAVIAAGAAHAATAYHYTGAVPDYTMAAWGIIEGATFWGRRITPDWDQENHVPFWVRPYAEIIPHRSYWSHGPIISTVLRVAYIWFILFVAGCAVLTLYAALKPANPYELVALYLLLWTTAPWQHIFWRVAGLMLSDIMHWLADGMPL